MNILPVYKVVRPFGRRSGDTISPTSPLLSLEGKTIGFMWTLFTNGDVLANALMDLIGKQFEGTKFAKLPPGKGRQWGNYPDDPSVGAVVKESGVDALIVTMGC